MNRDPRLAGALAARAECWPIRGGFAISRGARMKADVVVAEIACNGRTGRGECVPYARYGETVEGVLATIMALKPDVESGLTRSDLRERLVPGAARNAVDCALWDLEAKQSGRPAWEAAGIDELRPVNTVYTISLAEPEEMAAAARAAAAMPVLKLKLGRDGDVERLAAVREAVPDARLLVDANEGWAPAEAQSMLASCAAAGVELVEQPLPADDDALLADMSRPLPVCADESVHGLDTLEPLRGRYDAVNIKLDKTGGLTEALLLADKARQSGFAVMVGCMLATSLAMAPAMIVAQQADYVDLDGPLLLERDREHGIRYDGSLMHPPSPALWGA